jgi:hypothetical protein
LFSKIRRGDRISGRRDVERPAAQKNMEGAAVAGAPSMFLSPSTSKAGRRRNSSSTTLIDVCAARPGLRLRGYFFFAFFFVAFFLVADFLVALFFFLAMSITSFLIEKV